MMRSSETIHGKGDIINRNDLERIVVAFYGKVKSDEMLSPFFYELVTVDWNNHIPLMISFWEHVLFHAGSYRGNPMQKHLHLSNMKLLEPVHFAQWLKLWVETIDALYAGESADDLKRKAKQIATLMQSKISGSPSAGLI